MNTAAVTVNKVDVEQCPFCLVKPSFVDAINPDLTILTHKCLIVNYQGVAFKKDPKEAIDTWNEQIQIARRNLTVKS